MTYLDPSLVGALVSLATGAQWQASATGDLDADYASIEWYTPEISQPSKAACATEIARIIAEEPSLEEYEAATEYQRLRRPEYPPLENLADAIYWNESGDPSKLSDYVAECLAVKVKYPKP